MANGSFSTRRLTEYLDETRDAFDRSISDGTSNSVDVPSFYSFSPERLRLYINDARTAPSDAGAKFTDQEGNFRLSPAAGDKIEIHTAERPRYVVGYDAVATTAAKMESQLGTGDTFRVGVRDRADPENLGFFELNGDSDNRVVLTGSGSEIASDTFEFPSAVTEQTPVRYEIQFNWYGVGRWRFRISYTDNSRDMGERQVNRVVGELTVDGEWTTGDAAFHVFNELEASNSGVEAEVGSYAYSILGGVSETSRTKGSRLSGLSYSGSGDYEPLAAIQIDPDRGNVYTQLADTTVFPDGGSGELLTIVAQPSETDASGFTTPSSHSVNNSVVEQTTSVSTFPDSSGTVVSSAADPNGYQIAFTTFEEAGSGANTRLSQAGIDDKRPLYEDDVAIFLYKADTATARNVNITYVTEQNW